MLNVGLFDSFLFGTLVEGLSPTGSDDKIRFNDYGLQNNNIIVSGIEGMEKAPIRDFVTAKIPNDNGRLINSDFYDVKSLRLSGVILKSSEIAFESFCDEIKRNLKGQTGNLDFVRANEEIRRLKATWRNCDIKRNKHYNIDQAPFDFEFSCLTPFGEDEVYTSEDLFGQTSLALTEQLNASGTADMEGVFILNFSAVDTVTKIDIENSTTGEGLEINESISANDVVKIDGENKEVTINGVAVDYDGTFPDIQYGANSIVTTITATSATYTWTGKFKNKYL